jgi:hypothetical protein
MGYNHSEDQLAHCLELINRIDELFAQTFPEITQYALAYKCLFIGLYRNMLNKKPTTPKGEAEGFLRIADIKSPQVQAKIIAGARAMGYVQVRKNKADLRVSLVSMTSKLQAKIQEYLSNVLSDVGELKSGQESE